MGNAEHPINSTSCIEEVQENYPGTRQEQNAVVIPAEF